MRFKAIPRATVVASRINESRALIRSYQQTTIRTPAATYNQAVSKLTRINFRLIECSERKFTLTLTSEAVFGKTRSGKFEQSNDFFNPLRSAETR